MSEDKRKEEHDHFVKEIRDIMKKIKPDISVVEFNPNPKNLTEKEGIDLLIQIGTKIIIFECKLNENLKYQSKQLDNYKSILNTYKQILIQRGFIHPFSRIIRIYTIKEQNHLVDIDTNFVTDIYTTFRNNPKIILEQKY